mgnify:FL=1
MFLIVIKEAKLGLNGDRSRECTLNTLWHSSVYFVYNSRAWASRDWRRATSLIDRFSSRCGRYTQKNAELLSTIFLDVFCHAPCLKDPKSATRKKITFSSFLPFC